MFYMKYINMGDLGPGVQVCSPSYLEAEAGESQV